MLPSSKKILEGLLYEHPELLGVYKILDVGTINSVKHKEYKNIFAHFKKPIIAIVIGLTVSCFIIERNKKQSYNIIEISSEVYYYKTTSGKLKKRMLEILKQKDFIPAPLTKKIIFVNNYDKKDVDGEIYIEQSSNRYVNSEPNENGILNSYKPQELLQIFIKNIVIRD